MAEPTPFQSEFKVSRNASEHVYTGKQIRDVVLKYFPPDANGNLTGLAFITSCFSKARETPATLEVIIPDVTDELVRRFPESGSKSLTQPLSEHGGDIIIRETEHPKTKSTLIETTFGVTKSGYFCVYQGE